MTEKLLTGTLSLNTTNQPNLELAQILSFVTFSNGQMLRNELVSLAVNEMKADRHDDQVIMPPTSKKLTGHIGFGLCVRPSVHPSVQEPCMLWF